MADLTSASRYYSRFAQSPPRANERKADGQGGAFQGEDRHHRPHRPPRPDGPLLPRLPHQVYMLAVLLRGAGLQVGVAAV